MRVKENPTKVPVTFGDLTGGDVFKAVGGKYIWMKCSTTECGNNAVDLQDGDLAFFSADDVIVPFPQATIYMEN